MWDLMPRDSCSQSRKTRYRQLCASDGSVPIFCQDWWLDNVTQGKWDVALVEKDGRVLAAMPYAMRRRMGSRCIQQPALTQFSGPWLAPVGGKVQNRLGVEKDLCEALIDQLPAFDYFLQNWHFSMTNWMPFHWRGFRQTTRYTYRLPDLGNLDRVWEGFSPNIRRDLRKAQNRFSLVLREAPEIEDFIDLNKMTFERQGRAPPYSRDFVRRLDAVCADKRCRKIFIAEDAEGRAHAGAYVVWDENSAYYLMGGGDPALRTSGATSLVMWEAIRFSAKVTRSFDFEGSMIEPVERFFRAFGATQTPYHQVFKTSSRLLFALRALKELQRR